MQNVRVVQKQLAWNKESHYENTDTVPWGKNAKSLVQKEKLGPRILFSSMLHFSLMRGFKMVLGWPLTLIFFNGHVRHRYWMMTTNRYFPDATVFRTKLP